MLFLEVSLDYAAYYRVPRLPIIARFVVQQSNKDARDFDSDNLELVFVVPLDRAGWCGHVFSFVMG